MHHRDGPNQLLSNPPVLIKAEKADVPLPVDAGAERGESQLGLPANSPASHGFGSGGVAVHVLLTS